MRQAKAGESNGKEIIKTETRWCDFVQSFSSLKKTMTAIQIVMIIYIF